ncbi:MAG: hypothetical protein ABJB49_06120 [Nitrospirota bacterium]
MTGVDVLSRLQGAGLTVTATDGGINMRTIYPDEKRAELDRIAQVSDRLAEVAETTRAAGMNRR